MALFYRIDFAADYHRRRGYWQWVVAVVVAGLLAGAGVYAWMWYEESRLPHLKPRLAQYQSLVNRLIEAHQAWQKTAAACAEIRVYVEREDQIPPERMLPAVCCLSELEKSERAGGLPFRFLPNRCELRRDTGVVRLAGTVPLPERDKVEYCARVVKAVSALVTNHMAACTNRTARETFAFNWKKSEPTAQDLTLDAELTLQLGTGKPFVFPPVPQDLQAAVSSVDGWRSTVRKCVVRTPAKQAETVADVLERLLFENRQDLKASYDEVKAFVDNAVDPLAACEKIRRSLGERKGRGVEAFEEAWKEVAQRQWRREASLDNAQFNEAITNLTLMVAALPRNRLFEEGQEKCRSYLQSLSKGVQRKNIALEETFLNDVLLPCVTDGGRLAATLSAKIVPDDTAKRVAFPVWRVALGAGGPAGSAPRTKESAVALSDLACVLSNISTNPAGLWATAVTFEFDGAEADPVRRWEQVKAVVIEGRVPCWMEKPPEKEPAPPVPDSGGPQAPRTDTTVKK